MVKTNDFGPFFNENVEKKAKIGFFGQKSLVLTKKSWFSWALEPRECPEATWNLLQTIQGVKRDLAL